MAFGGFVRVWECGDAQNVSFLKVAVVQKVAFGGFVQGLGVWGCPNESCLKVPKHAGGRCGRSIIRVGCKFRNF